MSSYTYSDNNRFIQGEDEKWCLISGDLYDMLIQFSIPDIRIPTPKEPAIDIFAGEADPIPFLDDYESWERIQIWIDEPVGKTSLAYIHTAFICEGGLLPARFFNVSIQ